MPLLPLGYIIQMYRLHTAIVKVLRWWWSSSGSPSSYVRSVYEHNCYCWCTMTLYGSVWLGMARLAHMDRDGSAKPLVKPRNGSIRQNGTIWPCKALWLCKIQNGLPPINSPYPIEPAPEPARATQARQSMPYPVVALPNLGMLYSGVNTLRQLVK